MKYIIILTAITLSACGVDEQEDPKQWDTDKDPQTNNQNNPQDKKEDPVKEDPIKKDPPIKDPTARQWVKIYRHAAYSCAIDTNNTALCDRRPPRGPAQQNAEIPLELKDVQHMALGNHGYCVITTYQRVDCYGYKQPFLNGRFSFKSIAMSANNELCALGNYSDPLAVLSCDNLMTEERTTWFVDSFDANTRWASIDLSRTFLSRTSIICGLDLDGNGHCLDRRDERPTTIEGPFKQFIPHNYYTLCGLSPDGQWSCWNKTLPEQKVIFKGQYKRLLSSTCALTTDDRVQCWKGNQSPSADHTLIDPVGSPVKDFSQTPIHFFAYDNETDNHIKNWCAIDMKGQQTCAPYDNNEANGPSL